MATDAQRHSACARKMGGGVNRSRTQETGEEVKEKGKLPSPSMATGAQRQSACARKMGGGVNRSAARETGEEVQEKGKLPSLNMATGAQRDGACAGKMGGVKTLRDTDSPGVSSPLPVSNSLLSLPAASSTQQRPAPT